MPPHDYGVAVVLLSFAEHLVPPDQVARLREGIDVFLLASSLTSWTSPRARRSSRGCATTPTTLPEPSRTLMRT